jgi:predicted PhzF superfamily epimerase YddE/YHI9
MRFLQIDSFTDRPFAGNPAGVCLLDEPRDDAWMQAVAAEVNAAETAFLQQCDEPGRYRLRWFSPAVEVDLCGHATLASAHALWQTGWGATAPPDALLFDTRSGTLGAERVDGDIRLDFPADPPVALSDPELVDLVTKVVGIEARWVGRNSDKYLVVATDAAAVRAVTPDIAGVRALDAMGVIVTAQADPGDRADVVSRFFAPAVGIDEDPVTGAAHCCLGPYWASELGRDTLLGYQASARGGYVGVTVVGDRVLLTGQAVTVIRGEID